MNDVVIGWQVVDFASSECDAIAKLSDVFVSRAAADDYLALVRKTPGRALAWVAEVRGMESTRIEIS
jgi:hypothetical protein